MTEHRRPDGIDPDPNSTPGLGGGGSVEPGDTPPDTAQTSGLSAPESPLHKRFPPTGVGTILGIAVLVLLMVAVVVGIIIGLA